ncbi:GDP-mannose 4,6-dehydratase [Mammaliicoccus sciuri]|uniref:GDP-mannose 4,6-dehydratase n=1 Tax=Mammaliicoccus sciuri TaxID=1296 RepID=UPI00288699F9|nr:GDP-mannose 4,6-dehydratase [Mammaliicoccus sciuri]MDT0702590.1 GDP-mannose 4,6-dehydratase [Mammaliicoccus sciuri]
MHLAATVSVVETIDKPVSSNKVNVDGAVNLLEANRELNKSNKKFVIASSAEIYGNNDILLEQENVYIDPQSTYAGEQYTQIYYNLYGLSTTGLRIFNVY